MRYLGNRHFIGELTKRTVRYCGSWHLIGELTRRTVRYLGKMMCEICAGAMIRAARVGCGRRGRVVPSCGWLVVDALRSRKKLTDL